MPLTKIIDKGVLRTSKIVASLQHSSNSFSAPLAFCNIHSILDNSLLYIEEQKNDRIEIVKKYTSSPLEVNGYNEQLQQMFYNILINALQAIEQNGTITIETQKSGKEITIAISDTGCGISSENMDKILDPFFTTKAHGQGTGLGLSVAYSTIQKHNGSIEYESELNNGTKVMVHLPCADILE